MRFQLQKRNLLLSIAWYYFATREKQEVIHRCVIRKQVCVIWKQAVNNLNTLFYKTYTNYKTKNFVLKFNFILNYIQVI